MRTIKFFFLFTLLLLLAEDAVSQRIRADEAEFKYTRLPLAPLDKSITAYRIDLAYGKDITIEEGDVISKAFKNFTCEPLTRVNSPGENVLVLRVWIKPFHAGEPSMKTRELSTTVKEYQFTVAYEYPMPLDVLVGQNNEPIYKALYNENSYYYKTTNNTPAFKTVNSYDESIYDDMKELAIDGNVRKITSTVQSRYAFATVTVNQQVWSPKTTKKVDYTDLDSAQNKAVRAFKKIQPGIKTGLEEFRTRIQEPIDIWLNVLKESNVTDKKARIDALVTSSIRHNLAYAYFWLGEADKAEEQASLAAKEYTQNSWPEEILKEISVYRERIKANP